MAQILVLDRFAAGKEAARGHGRSQTQKKLRLWKENHSEAIAYPTVPCEQPAEEQARAAAMVQALVSANERV